MTSSDFPGLITDSLRFLFFSFAWWVGDRSRIKFRLFGTKTKPTWH